MAYTQLTAVKTH